MEHYVNHQGIELPIGKNENLHFTSYEKLYAQFRSGALSQANGSMPPLEFLRPENDFRYRFPFPDEWLLDFASVGGWPEDRGLLIRIDRGDYFTNLKLPYCKEVNVVRSVTQPDLVQVVAVENPNNHFEKVDLEIAYQDCTINSGLFILRLIMRCPYSGALITAEDLDTAQFVTEQIHIHYLQPATTSIEFEYWNSIVINIIRGYSGSLNDPDNF